MTRARRLALALACALGLVAIGARRARADDDAPEALFAKGATALEAARTRRRSTTSRRSPTAASSTPTRASIAGSRT